MSNNEAALPMFKAGVAMHINRHMGNRFIPTRYPWSYAADFLRGHEDLVPAWLRDQMDGSRSAASQVISQWAERLGIDDRVAAEVLAGAYIVENNVQGVPDELAQSAR